jgi:hypothetical protein
MTLAARLACNATLLRVMLESRCRWTRADLDALAALADDLAAEADALERQQARRAEHEYQTRRRAA